MITEGKRWRIRQASKATDTHVFQGVTEAKKKNTTDLDPLITIKWGFLKDLRQPSPLPVALGSTYIENTVLFGRKKILIKESRRKKKNALSKFFNYKLGNV